MYLRLGKNGEPDLLGDAPFTIGSAVTLADGGDIVLASTGPVLRQVLAAAARLERDGVHPTILHFGTVKPFDAPALTEAAARAGAVLTVEEHTIVGGLGSATAEALAEAGTGARLRRIGLRDTFAHEVGSQAHLLSVHGITEDQIHAQALELVSRAASGAAERGRERRGLGRASGRGLMPAATLTRAFDTAATAVAEQIRPLQGAAIHVNGASGFLASNLLALLNRADDLHGLGLRLHASARRPAGRVGLFRFLGLEPRVRWDLAPAESTTFPDELAGGVAVHTASYGAPADYLREPMATFQANTAGLIQHLRRGCARRGGARGVPEQRRGVRPAAELMRYRPARTTTAGRTSPISARSTASPSGWQRYSGGRCPARPASRSPRSGPGTCTDPGSASTTVGSRSR